MPQVFNYTRLSCLILSITLHLYGDHLFAGAQAFNACMIQEYTRCLWPIVMV